MQHDKNLPSPNPSPRDHLISSIKSGLNLLPFGGVIASLIGDYVPSSTQKAVWKAIEYLNQRIDALADRVDLIDVHQDEFSDSIKSFLLLSQRTSQDEKLHGAANLLANLLLKNGDPDKLAYTEIDHFWRCLGFLSIGAIQLLGGVCKMAKARNTKTSPGGEYMFTNGDVVPLMSDLPPHAVLSLVAELDAWNLLAREATTVSLASQGYRENDSVFLTPTGLQFVETVLQAGAGED